MQPVVTAEDMRALDRTTIELGLPAFTLMETAGRAVADKVMALVAGAGADIAVVCGPGNNGGDGFVVARVLDDRGLAARVLLAVPREKITGDARAHLELYERYGGMTTQIDDAGSLERIGLRDATLVVDALFGVGAVRPITGHLAEVVREMNSVALRVSVDLPSGLVADTGAVPEGSAFVVATHTVVMAARKVAHVSAPGFAHCGEVTVADIGIPMRTGGLGQPALMEVMDRIRTFVLDESDIRGWLPRPGPMDHKGTRGHTVIVSGAPEMRGAGRLAASAAAHALTALRAGTGLVTLAGDEGVNTSDDSVMTRVIAGPLRDVLEKKQAVVIGPGLGTSEAAAARVREVIALGVPAVLDADALNILASDPAMLRTPATGTIVITPHPGEAARLLGISTAEVEADRLAAARALGKLTNAVVMLKGARTVICDPTLRCYLNPTGSPALATGGTGDVLAGLVAGLLAQGVRGGRAACVAAYVHGRAGEVMAERLGRGAVSSDLPRVIAEVIAELTSSRAASRAPHAS